MNREIIIDIETTGLDFKSGDKIIEIACVEIINKVLTGRIFHTYLNTTSKISPKAFEIHGISKIFLDDKPKFSNIAVSLLKFIGDSSIIAHNAHFDIGFIDNELEELKLRKISTNKIIDTLKISKNRFPNSLINLNNLCRKFDIHLNNREKHGALVDAILLSKVYSKLSLVRSKEIKLFITKKRNDSKYKFFKLSIRQLKVSSAELLLHDRLIKDIIV